MILWQNVAVSSTELNKPAFPEMPPIVKALRSCTTPLGIRPLSGHIPVEAMLSLSGGLKESRPSPDGPNIRPRANASRFSPACGLHDQPQHYVAEATILIPSSRRAIQRNAEKRVQSVLPRAPFAVEIAPRRKPRSVGHKIEKSHTPR